MAYILISIGLLACAVQAVRAQRLLISALWLAGASALTALLMYLMGAAEVAVIELSVGAGLVTVLFVFAINIAGEENLNPIPLISRPVAWVLIVAAAGLLIWLSLGSFGAFFGVSAMNGFPTTLWEDRRLDVLLQIILIFAGVLGVLGLLAEPAPHKPQNLTSTGAKEKQV